MTAAAAAAVGATDAPPPPAPHPLVKKYLLSNNNNKGSAGGGGGNSLFMDHGPLQKDPIRVCLRLRPISKLELNRRSVNCCRRKRIATIPNYNNNNNTSASNAHTNNNNYDAKNSNDDDDCIHIHSPIDGNFQFVFDKIFSAEEEKDDAAAGEGTNDGNSSFTQDDAQLYQHAVAPLALHVMEGYSCACIAYGQTGSGKTHTMMGGTSYYSSSSSFVTKKNHLNHGGGQHLGMIPQFIKHIFQLIEDSPPSMEYIVRCSFVEIYLERILDLLNPSNRSICIASSSSSSFLFNVDGNEGRLDGDENENLNDNYKSNDDNGGEGVRLLNASEACCYNASDALALLVRGNACRTVSSTKLNTDSSRSHAIFIVKIEQKDNITGITKVGQIQLMDMAGSELARCRPTGDGEEEEDKHALQDEATMINKSISLLHTLVKTMAEKQNKSQHGAGDVIVSAKIQSSLQKQRSSSHHQKSKLTHLLHEVFGGNCRTSIILTASPASYNIAETIRTAKFGQLCRGIQNYIQPNIEMSPMDYRKLLNDSQKKQEYLVNLVNELSAECFQLKQDAKKSSFDETQYEGPLWKTIEAILVDGASPVANKHSSSTSHLTTTDTASTNIIALQEELLKARDELARSQRIRLQLENSTAERQSEVSVLKTQNDMYASDKKKFLHELVTMKNEIRLLIQRTQEVEHNLRTSQFREYEATVFLRQFRRFYRRLLRNKAHQGTGNTSDVIERVPGVPDLNDLIDVDSLLLEAGLIEDSELHDDAATGAYRPSAQALTRSTDAVNKAWKEAELRGKIAEVEAFDRSALRVVGGYKPILRGNNNNNNHPNGENADTSGGSTPDVSIIPNGQTISHRQQFLGTPAGRLITMHERDLERDLLSATERCIDLQVALNEEKSNVEILTNRAGNANKLKSAQESTKLRQQLDKKTHDLQAIIWKMNELHLINKTYNEKMSNREQHVTYLEENLVELQSANRDIILERQAAEAALRTELDNLKVLVDAMTVPLWQFGECGTAGKTLTSRIRLPVCGGDGINNVNDEDEGDDDDDEHSLESAVESADSSNDDDDDDDEGENDCETDSDEEEVVPKPAIASTPLREASTQTDDYDDDKSIIKSITYPPSISHPPSLPQAPIIHKSDTSTTSIASHVSVGDGSSNAMKINHYRGNLASTTTAIPISTMSTTNNDEGGGGQRREGIGGSLNSQFRRSMNLSHPSPSSSNHPPKEDDEEHDTTYLYYGAMSNNDEPRRHVHKYGLMIRPAILLKESSK